MLKVIQRFGKHCSFHLQGEYAGWAFSVSLIQGLLPALIWFTKKKIHPEDGNCNVN
jgi:hypothetical protein